ncbi:MAG TPA: site-specific integrase [Candidatus Sulfotelmatobacter sp.]|nr:site-specific integrase [Candidatus Sulfotelmatobacter sp.]
MDEITNQILNCSWKDKVKSNALDVVEQYAEFLKLAYERPNFRAYDTTEMYVPNPEMVKQFLYRVRSITTKAQILLTVETGASSGESWRLTWKDLNLTSKTVTVTGLKGHRTLTYPISEELFSLLIQIPRDKERIFSHISRPDNVNDTINDYKKRLAKETGNTDFLKIHFHTFRHYAISWHYFKTKDIVDTQRFARHCNIANTLNYVHIVKSWIKDNQYDVVYAEDKAELTKYLSEGFQLVTKTDWGYCLSKPKSLT